MNLPALAVLDETECLRLLATQQIGRVGITLGAEPVILPVTYALDGTVIVFRTEVGGALDRHLRDARVVFEVDELMRVAHGGWSVLVHGRAEPVHEPAARARLDALGLVPWAAGVRDRHVRIVPDHITGRRLTTAGQDDSHVLLDLSSDDAIDDVRGRLR